MGGDLKSLLEKDRQLPEDSIHDFACGLAASLQYCHSQARVVAHSRGASCIPLPFLHGVETSLRTCSRCAHAMWSGVDPSGSFEARVRHSHEQSGSCSKPRSVESWRRILTAVPAES